MRRRGMVKLASRVSAAATGRQDDVRARRNGCEDGVAGVAGQLLQRDRLEGPVLADRAELQLDRSGEYPSMDVDPHGRAGGRKRESQHHRSRRNQLHDAKTYVRISVDAS